MNKKKMNKRVFKMIEEVLRNDAYAIKSLNLKWYDTLDKLVKENKIDYFIMRYFINKSSEVVNYNMTKNSQYNKVYHKHIYSH